MINNYIIETGIVQSLVTKDDIVLDIGANVGYFTILLAGLAKHVYAFEPSPDNFKQLQENTKHLDNVEIYDIALSNEIGYKTLYTCPTDNGMNRLYDSQWCKDGDKIEVPVSTIDIIFIAGHFPHKISFVKMDVEGYEYHVLTGMMNIIVRDHPIIMMEFHPPSILESGSNPQNIYDLLKYEFGYNSPLLISNNSTIESYAQLFEITNNCPAVNILWKHNEAYE
jgi:FkbM family methyltransferase